MPRRIGVVTSPTGAAIHDILRVLRARFPVAAVLLYPTAVQGAAAVPEIVRAIEAASRRNECDVLIIARGGGSLEDLWCFNDERVARAIAACRIPTVSGVGHEVDVTIADFVADLRAPTPSAAALAATPDKSAWLESLALMDDALRRRHGPLPARAWHWASGALAQRLQVSHPGARLLQHAQRLDDLEQRLRLALRAAVLIGHAQRLDSAEHAAVARKSASSARCAVRHMRRRCGSGLSAAIGAHARRRSSSAWRWPRARWTR